MASTSVVISSTRGSGCRIFMFGRALRSMSARSTNWPWIFLYSASSKRSRCTRVMYRMSMCGITSSMVAAML
ncbi:hypothetical protein D3C72_2157660 [compost metagenome]